MAKAAEHCVVHHQHGDPCGLGGGAERQRVQYPAEAGRIVEPANRVDDAGDQIVAGMVAALRDRTGDVDRGAFDVQPVRPGVALDDVEQFGGERLELIVGFLPDSGEESFDRFAKAESRSRGETALAKPSISSAFTSTSRGNLSRIEGLSALSHFLQLALQVVSKSW
jgi:hypothetical protein